MVARLIRKDALEPSYKRDGCFVGYCDECLLPDCISLLSSADETRLLALDFPTPDEARYVKAIKDRKLLVRSMAARGMQWWQIRDALRIEKRAIERDLR